MNKILKEKIENIWDFACGNISLANAKEIERYIFELIDKVESEGFKKHSHNVSFERHWSGLKDVRFHFEFKAKVKGIEEKAKVEIDLYGDLELTISTIE